MNTKGVHDEQVPEELVRFLNYVGGEKRGENKMADKGQQDPLIRQIDARIANLKQNSRMEEQFMLFGEMLDDERKEGFEEGYRSCEDRLLALIDRMQAEGFAAEIPRLSKEPDFLKEMYKRFHLDK